MLRKHSHLRWCFSFFVINFSTSQNWSRALESWEQKNLSCQKHCFEGNVLSEQHCLICDRYLSAQVWQIYLCVVCITVGNLYSIYCLQLTLLYLNLVSRYNTGKSARSRGDGKERKICFTFWTSWLSLAPGYPYPILCFILNDFSTQSKTL